MFWRRGWSFLSIWASQFHTFLTYFYLWSKMSEASCLHWVGVRAPPPPRLWWASFETGLKNVPLRAWKLLAFTQMSMGSKVLNKQHFLTWMALELCYGYFQKVNSDPQKEDVVTFVFYFYFSLSDLYVVTLPFEHRTALAACNTCQILVLVLCPK